MRRSGWRRILVVILSMAMVWALAPGAVAKKPPGTPGGGGGGGSSYSIAVELYDAHTPRFPYLWEEPMGPGFPFHWIARAGDRVVVRVVVSGPDGSVTVCDDQGIFGLCVGAAISGGAVTVDSAPFAVPGGAIVTTTDKRGNVDAYFPFEVTVEGAAGTASAAIEIQAGGVGDPTCEVDTDGVAVIDGFCVWYPGELGFWNIEILAYASGTGKSARLPGLTLRDHVPGNWCIPPTDDYFEDPANWNRTFVDGWNTDATIRTVYLPTGNVDGEYPGVCLREGAGGRNTMGVGNPTAFYLVTDATVQFTWLGTQP